MRPPFALLLFGLTFLGSGCALFGDASRNIGVSLARPVEQKREWQRNYQWAEQAWAESCAADGATARSEDYAAGFKDGFAEYLFRGGNGEPPLVAPLRYRGFRYQTPEGYQAIDDWFAGYRHGASAAKKSGAREWITGPSSLRAGVSGAQPPAATPASPEVLPGAPENPAPQVLPRRIGDSAPPQQPAPAARLATLGLPRSAGSELPPSELAP
jgi:hypothetical protein